MDNKKIKNVKVEHGDIVFYTDSITVFHNNSKFVFDFKQTTPRIDQINNRTQETVVISHNVVMMDPIVAKLFLKLLEENIRNFEEKFGEIKLPEARDRKEERKSFGYIA